MEGLREHAKSQFIEKIKPTDSASPFSVVEICAPSSNSSPTDHATFLETTVPKEEILNRFQTSPGLDLLSERPSLKLTDITTSHRILNISQQLFFDLISACSIELFFLRTLANKNKNSFENSRSYIKPANTSDPNTNSYVDSFLFNDLTVAVLWSLNYRTRKTHVIIVNKHNGSVGVTKDWWYKNIRSQLEIYKSLVNSPLLVHFVISVVFADNGESNLEWVAEKVLTAEKKSQQEYIGASNTSPPELGELLTASKETGFSLTMLLFMTTHVDVLLRIVDTSQGSDTVAKEWYDGGADMTDQCGVNNPVLIALRFIESELLGTKVVISLVEERAKAQSAVVSLFPKHEYEYAVNEILIDDEHDWTKARRSRC